MHLECHASYVICWPWASSRAVPDVSNAALRNCCAVYYVLMYLHIDVSGVLKLALCQERGAQPEVQVQGAGGGPRPEGPLVLLGGLAGVPCGPVDVAQQDTGSHILWVGCTSSFLGSLQSTCVTD